MVRLNPHFVGDLLRAHRRAAGQQPCQFAFVRRVQVLDQDDAHAGVRWQVC